MQPAPPAKNSWILSPAWDIALFIASPLAAIVTLIPLAGYFPSADFGAFLLAFFTFGHHLPGFLRAYGDADLRRRRRIAFFAAPPIIFAAAYGLAAVDLHGLLFVVFTWDIWHVLMQQYGFLRIYDSKIGAIDRLTAWGDRAVSLSWYVTFIALSPHYTHDLLLRGYSTGLPAVSPSFLQSVRAALLGVSVVLSAAYLIRQCSLWKRGTPVSWKKLLALVCFLCATWFLYVAYPDFVVGFAVWSAFHCVQYYGIVWAFNQQRAAKPDAGALVRFLFRPRIGLVLLYGALILGYGAINWSQRYLSGGTLLTLLTAFVVTSGTLHYYFDGFIWRVREKETRRPLVLDAAPAEGTFAFSPALAQAVVAGLAVIGLAALELYRPYDDLRVKRDLASANPGLSTAQRNYATALRRAGENTSALPVYEAAMRLDPRVALARHEYGLTLAAMNRPVEAVAAFETALSADPQLRAAHYNAASLLVRSGQSTRALAHFRAAFPTGDENALRELEREPAAAEVLNNIALGFLQSGDRAEALRLLKRAVAIDPQHAAAHLNLASLFVMNGDRSNAQIHYRAAIANGDAPIRSAAEKALSRIR